MAIALSAAQEQGAVQGEQVLHAQVGDRQHAHRDAQDEQHVGAGEVLGPEAHLDDQVGRHGEDDQRRHGDRDDDAQGAHEHRPGVETLGVPAGGLGKQVEADPHGDPDDDLGGDGGGRVGPGGVGAELVLGHDHVDVLEDRDHHQADDRHPAVADEVAQAVGRGVRALGAQRAVQPHADDDGDGEQGERGAQEGAGGAQAGRGEDDAEEEAADLLGDHARADRAVHLLRLQDAAFDREQHPQHRGGGGGRGSPDLFDTDGVGKLLAAEDREDEDDDRGDAQGARPAGQRGRQVAARAQVPEGALAGHRGLQRAAGHREDEEGGQERGERAVLGDLQQPAEGQRGDQRHRVGDDHGAGQPGRLGQLRALQTGAMGRRPVPHAVEPSRAPRGGVVRAQGIPAGLVWSDLHRWHGTEVARLTRRAEAALRPVGERRCAPVCAVTPKGAANPPGPFTTIRRPWLPFRAPPACWPSS